MFLIFFSISFPFFLFSVVKGQLIPVEGTQIREGRSSRGMEKKKAVEDLRKEKKRKEKGLMCETRDLWKPGWKDVLGT